MKTKLTLTIEASVIERARHYARQQGRSLSDIVENYLLVITPDGPKSGKDIAPITKSLKGSFKAPAGFDYKKDLTKGLSDKYL